MTEPSARSYRDRHSVIHLQDDAVIRTFDSEGATWFLSAHEAGLLSDLRRDGLIVDYSIRSVEPLTVESPLLPVVTFPYEWTPSMLKDAAAVTLELAIRAWDAGFHLRDASAFNIVFHDGRPLMVDLGSFRPGHTPFFLAYGQFCDHFLNPLAVADSLDVSPRSLWWSLEGLGPVEARRLMGRKAFRPRYLRYIWARARLEARSESFGEAQRRDVRTQYGLPPEAIRKAMVSLQSLIETIEPSAVGVWGSYEQACSYEQAETDLKGQFVAQAASSASGRTALDIGANAGHFSQILAPHFETVIAVEPDEAAADTIYQRIKLGAIPSNVFPMVIDIVDPPGGRGFGSRERPSALERIERADFAIWLAVIHHLVLGRNVPLPMVFNLAKRLARRHVFEHVDPSDDMSQLLLSSKDEIPWPLDRDAFEAALARDFQVIDTVEVTPTRRLYSAVALE